MYLLLLLPVIAKATYTITVYGDVRKDTTFFTKTYPWIIDNVGGDISVDYNLLGSGRYSVPQMCALNQLKSNTFLQAEFLKCEAEGIKSVICLCKSGIDPLEFKQCVLAGGREAGLASSKYSQLGLDASPIIDVGYKNTVFGVSDEWYLKKICTIFGDEKPRGCQLHIKCDNKTDIVETGPNVYFDCDAAKGDNNLISTTDVPTYSSIATTEYVTEEYYTTWPILANQYEST